VPAASLWTTIADRLRALASSCRARHGAFLFLPEILARSARTTGVPALPIQPELDDAGAVAIGVAGYVAVGQVKLTGLVNDKAQSTPFRGALDFRSGDAADDPLRRAVVLAIAMALEDARIARKGHDRNDGLALGGRQRMMQRHGEH
jgi:hypothetical protein